MAKQGLIDGPTHADMKPKEAKSSESFFGKAKSEFTLSAVLFVASLNSMRFIGGNDGAALSDIAATGSMLVCAYLGGITLAGAFKNNAQGKNMHLIEVQEKRDSIKQNSPTQP